MYKFILCLLQVLAAFIANLGTINTGLVFGFSAVAIPQLEEADSFIKIDEEQASWIGKYTEQEVTSRLSLQITGLYTRITYIYALQITGKSKHCTVSKQKFSFARITGLQNYLLSN
jgi:hypothetical protein